MTAGRRTEICRSRAKVCLRTGFDPAARTQSARIAVSRRNRRVARLRGADEKPRTQKDLRARSHLGQPRNYLRRVRTWRKHLSVLRQGNVRLGFRQHDEGHQGYTGGIYHSSPRVLVSQLQQHLCVAHMFFFCFEIDRLWCFCSLILVLPILFLLFFARHRLIDRLTERCSQSNRRGSVDGTMERNERNHQEAQIGSYF